MVVRLLACLLLIFFPSWISAQQVRVFADIDPDTSPNSAVMGTLSVEHPNTIPIDKNSIRFQNAPLNTELIKEVKYSPQDSLTLSLYRFRLPPMQEGLQVLGSISVKVGDKMYQTIPSTFEVKKARPKLQQPVSKTKPKGGKPILILEAFAEPYQNLFPGQRTKVGYRYYFDHSIEATKEDLPLLDAEGFKKLGGKITRSAQEDQLSLLEVAQEIEAIKPGEYTFGPSYYEGYITDESGNRMEPLLKATAPQMKIVVSEFPQNIKPPSFKNAIGKYTFATKLDSTTQVEVGEKMLLRAIIKGSPLEGVELPDLCCQPGMAGRFHFSDIPPSPEQKEDSVQFVVEIRPSDAEIKEIPSLEFSFFNPEKGIFEKVASQPIPIKVTPIITEEESPRSGGVWPTINTAPQAISIAELKEISPPGFVATLLTSWWGLFSVPIALGVVYFQVLLKQGLVEIRARQSRRTSRQLLDSLPQLAPQLLPSTLHECFLLKLVETGAISEVKPYETLSNEGPQGNVKEFLRKVDAWHYAEGTDSKESLIREAEILYRELCT